MKYLFTFFLTLFLSSNTLAEVILLNKSKQHDLTVSYVFCRNHLGRPVCKYRQTITLSSNKEGNKNNIYTIKDIPNDMTWVEILSVVEKDISGNVISTARYSIGKENLCRMDILHADIDHNINLNNNAIFIFKDEPKLPVILCTPYGYV